MKPWNDPQKILANTSLVDTFLELTQIDTQSKDASDTFPSTQGQWTALKLLKDKLTALGLKDAEIDDNGYLFATLPGNRPKTSTIGLLAHIDTAPDFSGKHVKPQLHSNYDGKALRLAGGVVISPEENPELTQCVGDTLITSDGTTLLGADDKAGVAEILATVELLLKNPEVPRPTLRIGFTPDEEIGLGASRFDVQRFGARCAYTVDGGFAGELNGETFSADAATVSFEGVAVHPGYAKDKLVNAIRYASAFVDRLPAQEAPEHTEGREGFFHPTKIEGNASLAKVSMILRDFDDDKLAARGSVLQDLAKTMMKEQPRLGIRVEISQTYRNMAKWLKGDPTVMETLENAVAESGITPKNLPVRGGTDGSGLTAKGLPTPNLFAGGVNFHGPREWVSTRVMGLAVCSLMNLVQRWGEIEA